MILKPKINHSKITDKIEDFFDFDFHAETVDILSVEEFEDRLISPYINGKQIFYRGERISSITRPLLPSIFRQRDAFFEDGSKVALVNSEVLYDYYKKHTQYFSLYENIIGSVKLNKMYSFLAFSQHYFGVSPMIDFTKSLFVALSFALKNRSNYAKDILIYTLELKNENDYTDSREIANKWLGDYSVLIYNNTVTALELENPLDTLNEYRLIYDSKKNRSFADMTSPSAKLIDVPTNDLMNFQQGVFLLLDDFNLIGNAYLTKKLRDDFTIKKWIISRDICPELLKRLTQKYPYYSYEYLTDLQSLANAIKNNSALI